MTEQRIETAEALHLTERIAAPREAVFEFLVDPGMMLRWMGTEVDLEPQPGGRFWLNATGTDIASGSFVEVDPPNRVVFTWGWEGSTEVPPGSSTVTITLTADGDDTVLELVHAGLPGGADDEHSKGWNYFLPRLGIVAGGGVVDPGAPADTSPSIVDHDSWLAARLEHLEAEKAFTRQRDELSRQRRSLPWVEVDPDYSFHGLDGPKALPELFEGRSQLAVYHFMFGPGWGEGCPSCSFWADNYDGIGVHLAARDTTLVAISIAPLAELEAYRQRMGWSFPWYSSAGGSFNYDMGVSFTPEQIAAGTARYNLGTQTAYGEENPGLSIFNRTDDDRVFLSYQTFSRGLDMFNSAYQILDLTPKGRDEDELEWSMAWLRRHDAYSSG